MATEEGSGFIAYFLMGCATWPVITPKIIPEGDGELYADFPHQCFWTTSILMPSAQKRRGWRIQDQVSRSFKETSQGIQARALMPGVWCFHPPDGPRLEQSPFAGKTTPGPLSCTSWIHLQLSPPLLF